MTSVTMRAPALLPLLAGLAAALPLAPELKVSFTPQANGMYGLVFTGQSIPASAKSVSVHYSVNGEAQSAKASRAGGNWQLQQANMAAGTYNVAAWAVIRQHSGGLEKTELTQLNTTLGHAVTKLPSRMIRSSVIFRDDFQNSGSIALSWDHEVSMYGGYNGEFQVYTKSDKNVYVANDLLYLKPTYTVDDPHYQGNNLYHGTMDMNQLYGTCTQSGVSGCHRDAKDGILPPIMSGKVKSRPTLRYGTVTVRARIPQGDWIWPAIWMLPKSSKYGGWPRSGEIDIMESRGNQGSYGVGHVSSNLHWGADPGSNQFQRTAGAKYTGNWHNDFHIWKLEWTPSHIITYIDDQQIMYVDPGSNFWSFGNLWSHGNSIWGNSKMAPFDQDFYMIFNVAVGGTSGFFNGHGQPWTNSHGQRGSQADFWGARNSWQNTWRGDDVALLIDWVEFKSYY